MGGNSTKATSGINGAGTVAQAELGIKDTPKAFFNDTKKSVSRALFSPPRPSSPADRPTGRPPPPATRH